MSEDTRLDSLKDRIENLERALDERATNEVFGRCYLFVTLLLSVLVLLPVAHDRTTQLTLWSALAGTGGPVNDTGWITVIWMVPLWCFLITATIRPSLGWLIAAFAVAFGVTRLIGVLQLEDRGWDITPVGYGLVAVAVLVAVLGAAHARNRRRLAP